MPTVNHLSTILPTAIPSRSWAPSSSGSTIISLKCFYDPLESIVKLIDLRELNVRWLQTQVRLVSQEPVFVMMI